MWTGVTAGGQPACEQWMADDFRAPELQATPVVVVWPGKVNRSCGLDPGKAGLRTNVGQQGWPRSEVQVRLLVRHLSTEAPRYTGPGTTLSERAAGTPVGVRGCSR